jgi:hypothetical protein
MSSGSCLEIGALGSGHQVVTGRPVGWVFDGLASRLRLVCAGVLVRHRYALCSLTGLVARQAALGLLCPRFCLAMLQGLAGQKVSALRPQIIPSCTPSSRRSPSTALIAHTEENTPPSAHALRQEAAGLGHECQIPDFCLWIPHTSITMAQPLCEERLRLAGQVPLPRLRLAEKLHELLITCLFGILEICD